MKVILNQDIDNLGGKYDVKNVSDGYARNFLLPRKLVMPAAEQALKNLARQKTEWETKEKEIRKELEQKAQELEKQKFEFKLKIGEKGEVFGSIGKNDIEKALRQVQGLELKNLGVIMDKPIKELGEKEIEVNLGKEVKAKIRLFISH